MKKRKKKLYFHFNMGVVMAKVYDLTGKVVEEAKLPDLFSSKYNPLVIRRAFLYFISKKRQPYGSNVLAGKRTSAHYHGLRRYRFTMMNREMSRIPRLHGKIGFLSMVARRAPHAVKGRRAHPPKSEKNWAEKLNKKEYKAALKFALASSSRLVSRRHAVNVSPIIFIDDLENIKKTKDVMKALKPILKDELKRCSVSKIRSGKGKTRGRKYRKKKGPLFIVSKKCSLLKAANNIPGFDVTTADAINIELLAPGGEGGRATIITKSALEVLDKKFGK